MLHSRFSPQARLCLAAWLAGLWALYPPALAAPDLKQPPPATRVDNCTTGGCHSDQIKFAFLHAPAAAGACEMCHSYANEQKHTFALKHEGAAMCDFCHIGKTDAGGLHVHQPVQEGQCIKCHNPHGSEHRNLINGATTGAMCLTCHESVIKDRAHVHAPIAQGDCLGCHKAHSSILPKLMVEQGRTLCLKCHSTVEKEAQLATAAAEQAAASRAANVVGAAPATDPGAPPGASIYVHEPFMGECTQCHEQHASNAMALLKQDPVGLCTSCHRNVADELAGATVQHSAVMTDRACMNCHAAHTSHAGKLMKGTAVTVCLDCHNKEIKKADGTLVHSVAELAADGQHGHGPLVDGACTGCHNVHGAAHRALLVRPYTQTFYQSFDPQAYSLCFGCHDQELATARTTTTATKFRNGDVNLHFVHVTAPGDAGRSCRVCHATHSAANTKQVRDAVPYGKWNVPLSFQATQTGGSCGAGCHRARQYDRMAPVRVDAPNPAMESKPPG